MISNLLNSFLICVFFADMFERRYPEEFKNCLVTLSYNIIYFYSKSQILFMKYNKKLNDLIERNPSLLKIKNDFNLLISQSDKRCDVKYVKDCNVITGQYKHFEYDFVITGKPNTILKEICYKGCYNTNPFEVSDIKFLLLEFKFGEKSFKIDLKTEDFNYYLVENKFTKNFFIFYLKHHLNINEEINESYKFSLKIIDHDVNTINLDFTDKNESIVLEKNSYNIINGEENNE